MKKPICLGLILAFFTLVLQAQEKENIHEIRTYLSDGIVLTLGSAIATTFVPGAIDEVSSSPHIAVSYRYQLKPRFLVGGDMGFQNITWKPSMGSTNYTSIMPLAEFYYLNKRTIKLYGNAMIGLGIGFYKDGDGETISGVFPSFQLNPIGIRIGKNYAGFLEAGGGVKGFFSAGFSAKF